MTPLSRFSSHGIGAACALVFFWAQPAFSRKIEAPVFPILESGAINNEVVYSSAPPVVASFFGKWGNIDQIDVFSIHNGTETLAFTIVGDRKFNKIYVTLANSGKYRVRGESGSVIIVVDTGTPTSVGAPAIRRDCHDGGALLISGTAADALSGVRKVEVAVVQDEKNRWWNGADWTEAGTWLTTSGKDHWELRLPRDFQDGHGPIHIFASAMNNAKSRESPHEATLQIPHGCPQ